MLKILLGLIVVFKGQTTLPWWSYIIALFMGVFITVKLYFVKQKKPFIFMRYVQPFSTILVARMGSGVGTVQLMKMIASVIIPGRPVANLYVSTKFCLPDEICLLSLVPKKFSMWSHDVKETSLALAADLKIGQYLKVPPRAMFITQVWGTLVG